MDRFHLNKNSTPQICGFFSVNSGREFEFSFDSLRYFKEPLKQLLPIDLNVGINSFKNMPTSYYDEKMDTILKYIVKNKDYFECNTTNDDTLIPSTNYITYRGLLRRIMRSPFENKYGWCLLASKYKNNIYMSLLTKENEIQDLQKEWIRRSSYYIPKFKQHCLTDDPFKMPDTSKEVDDSSQFFGVFKRMLVGRDFIFAGELDGIDSPTPVDLNNREIFDKLKFVELKVATDLSYGRKAPEMFRCRCSNVWAQSYLTGVKDIYFAMRTKEGIVQKIDHYSIDKLVQLGENYWNPIRSFEFLDSVLSMIEEKINSFDCPDTVFEFTYNEKNSKISCTQHYGRSDLSLLPKWYLDAFQP